jgi:hypothetical protein
MSELQTLVDCQRSLFIKGESGAAPVYMDDNGYPCMKIGEEELPLFTQDFLVSIVQPGSVQQNPELKPHKGKFNIAFGGDDSEFVDELWLMPITIINRGFTRFEGDYNNQQNPKRVCWSNNGLTHAPEVMHPYCAKCANPVIKDGIPYVDVVCPEAKYVEGQRSNCRQHINVAFFDIKREVPLRFSLHGTGMSAWSALTKDYVRTVNNARRKRINIGEYIIHATLDDQGTYYKPVFQFVQANPEIVGDHRKYQPIVSYYMMNLYNKPVEETQTANTRLAALPEETAIDVLDDECDEIQI